MDTTRPSLLLRIRDLQDQSAWFEFDAIYRPLLNRFARARGLEQAETEEIAQDCMASVHKYISSFDYDPAKGRFKSWLRTMVNNKIKNAIRGRHEVQARTNDFNRPQQQEPTPEQVFDTLWEEEHLRHCLRLVRDEVEASTFNAFFALVMEERPIECVCSDFDMTAAHVRVIKSRMTNRIRRKMTELLGESE